MAGSAGILKADWKAESYNHDAASVRIDDIINGRFRDVPVCMVKADVEGYEPQVLQTARRLLTRKRVPALQLELTRTPKTRNQTCAMVKTLAHLADLGYDFRQVNNRIVDLPAPPVGQWSETDTLWKKLPQFPSQSVREATERVEGLSILPRHTSKRNQAMQVARRPPSNAHANTAGTLALPRSRPPCIWRVAACVPQGFRLLLNQPSGDASGRGQELRRQRQWPALPAVARAHMLKTGSKRRTEVVLISDITRRAARSSDRSSFSK